MPALKNDKFKYYARYTEHCLNMVAETTTKNRVPSDATWPPNG